MSERKKVAVILHGLGANGIDTLYANLAEQWDQQQFDITYFIAVDPQSHQFWDERVAAAGIPVIKLHDLDKGRLKKFPSTLYHSLKKYGPFDVIHINMDMLSGVCALVSKFAGVKTRIIHAHRGSSDMPANPAKRMLKRLYLGSMKCMMRMFSTHRIGCSDIAGNYFFGRDNYQLVYNGINIDNYFVERSSANVGTRFVAVGRITPPKNPINMVEIFSEIHKRMPNATLTWLGDGQLREDVEDLVTKLGLTDVVKLMGVRSDVNSFLKNADYYLLPSLYEGLSLALAEAQAAGLICFISDTCSNLSDCGLCHYIPLSDSPDKWATQICDFIDSGKKLQLDMNRLMKFSITTTARTLEDIYRK